VGLSEPTAAPCGEAFDKHLRGAQPAPMAFVYMLRCADGSYYVGSTRSLGKRIWEHQEGLGADYTRRRRPVELVWHAEYPNIASCPRGQGLHGASGRARTTAGRTAARG
jgi:putative endonuclease